MRLSDTIARLRTLRRTLPMPYAPPARLHALADFGANPGDLDAFAYVPRRLPNRGAALVVVLHGCTQTAAGYDEGSGWSTLADDAGFALVYPQQRRANNPNLCFNWFSASDTHRSGEAQSIRNMIEAMIAAHAIDPARVFVTGLSAGGAMAAALLCNYPETFAGGAMIAGLPFGSATNIPQAFERMRGHGMPGPHDLVSLARAASLHGGPWPVVSVWHGTADQTVAPSNADAIVAQWLGLHNLVSEHNRVESIGAHKRRVWTDTKGRDCIEQFSVAALGHGTPIATSGPEACGRTAPYMLEASISSTRRIARFWGLTESVDLMLRPPPSTETRADTTSSPSRGGVGKIITDALRQAGLMR